MTTMMLCKSQFARQTQIVRRRLLPGSGTVLAHVGDRVDPDDIIAQAQIEGQVVAIDLMHDLRTSVSQALRCLRVAPGDHVRAGDLLATRGGIVRRQATAAFDGQIQAIEDGYVFVRQDPQTLSLRAFIPGQVIEQYPHRGVAIRVAGTLLRGVWGCGGETQGMLINLMRAPDERLTWEHVGLRYRGSILLGGKLDDPRVIQRARQFRLKGLIVGSLNPAIRELCQRSGLTVVVTEGMGHVAMAKPIFEALSEMHGRLAILAGDSAGEQGGPEVIVPFPGGDMAQALAVVRPLQLGAHVRLTRAPLLGELGEIVALPATPQETAIGTHAEGAVVRLRDGRQIFVPLVNMEALD